MNILTKKSKWATINIIGIAIAFASVLFVSAYTIKELSFDNFHSKADQIYRINIDEPGRVGFMENIDDVNSASLHSYYTESLLDNFPEVKNMTYLSHTFNLNLKVNEEIHSLENSFYTDHTFFELFDFKLLKGNRSTALNNPYEIILSKTAAIQYFGDIDIIGKEVKVKGEFDSNNGQTFTVTGIFDEFPDNSHMAPDVLLSINFEESNNSIGYPYTYLHFENETNPNHFIKSLNKYWKKNVAEGELAPTFQLINIRDIHLQSHKKDELGTNGNMNTLWVLIFGAVIILLIAMINYYNLNSVQLHSDLNNLKIKIINGASLINLSSSQLKKSALQIIASILIGTIITLHFDYFIDFQISISKHIILFLYVAIGFIIGFGILGLLPLITNNITANLSQKKEEGSKKFVISLIGQFVLSIAALTLTIVIHKQITFTKDFHPGKNKETIIAIKNFPYAAIQNFDLLKENVLKHPEINYFSATMMPPGMSGEFEYSFEMEGIEKKTENRITINSVDQDFFKLFEIQPLAGNLNLQKGSNFAWESSAIIPYEEISNKRLAELEPIHHSFKEQYILNETALKKLGFKNPQDVIGKQFKFNFRASNFFKRGEIVAVIKDLHYADMFSHETAEVIGLKQIFNGTYLAKFNPKNKAEALNKLNEEWNKLFPNYPMKYDFLNDIYAKLYRNQYNEMRTLTLFAILSILLSIMGMYALSSYSIQHKTKEIGIRKANGASSIEIMREIIGEYSIWVALAFVIACPIAYYAASDWLESFAYKINLSWWIFALSGVIAILIAIITVSWQTWNAARKDPVYALKNE
ncbi:ABC transporter permease [Marinifilum breve]|nr:ABC transporter permease [Marinifilum breve]